MMANNVSAVVALLQMGVLGAASVGLARAEARRIPTG